MTTPMDTNTASPDTTNATEHHHPEDRWVHIAAQMILPTEENATLIIDFNFDGDGGGVTIIHPDGHAEHWNLGQAADLDILARHLMPSHAMIEAMREARAKD